MSSFCFFMGCAKIAAYQIFRARSASTTYSSSPIGSSPMLAGLCRTAHLAYLLKFHACSFSIWTFSVFWSGSEVVFTLSLPLPTFLDRPEWRCAMTVQLKLDARMNEANTPDLSAMEMPTLRRLEKTSLSGLRKHLPKQLEPRTSRYMVHPKTHACPSQPSVQGVQVSDPPRRSTPLKERRRRRRGLERSVAS